MASINGGMITSHMNYLLVFCCGGHARSTVSIALENKVTQIVIIDPNAKPNETLLGFPVLSGVPVECSNWPFICASGDNGLRRATAASYSEKGHEAITIIAETATVSNSASVGSGVFIGHNAHLGPEAAVGDGCIINTGAVVEHNAVVGPFSHVAVSATMCGRSRLGEDCLLGANATIIDNVKVCDRVVIGAGSTVVRDIESPGTYVGAPACLTGRRGG